MHDTTEHHDEHHPVGSVGSMFRLLLGFLLVAAIVAFAVDNRDQTRVGWVFGDTEAPLSVVLGATAVAGAIVGWLLLHRAHRPRHPVS